jgi:hypothetical protein
MEKFLSKARGDEGYTLFAIRLELSRYGFIPAKV